jgi:putative restriction endonuclease
MCETQLRLIDGAHILPVEHAGNDQTRNGVALCALHHRAYDRSLVTFGPDLKVHVNAAMAKKLKSADRAGGLKDFEDRLRPILITPADKKDRPWKSFVVKANELRGWSL